MLRAILVAVLLGTTGCSTHQQLACSTVKTTSTIRDIEYKTVLMNLAMMACQPEGLPNHVRMKDGVVQINDQLAFGESGGFTTFDARRFGFEQWGPSGSRQVTEQWGTDAVTDPQDVKALQDIYRAALGLPPLPDPPSVAFLKHSRSGSSVSKKDSESNKGGEKSDGSQKRPEQLPPPQIDPARFQDSAPSKTSTGGGGSTLSSGGGSSSGNGDVLVPIEILLAEIPPPGWFHTGCKKDVPKNACYVGCWCDTYAWVTPEGMPALSQFTLTLLSILKFKPSDARSPSGLAVTR